MQLTLLTPKIQVQCFLVSSDRFLFGSDLIPDGNSLVRIDSW